MSAFDVERAAKLVLQCLEASQSVQHQLREYIEACAWKQVRAEFLNVRLVNRSDYLADPRNEVRQPYKYFYQCCSVMYAQALAMAATRQWNWGK